MPFSILIVEDDNSFRKLLEIRLRTWKQQLNISTASTIKDAEELLNQNLGSFDLVILDQHLPDGVGSSLLNHQAIASCAVLALSADESAEIPGQAVLAGAHHFLNKRQISEPLFLPLLDALIERKKLEDRIREGDLRKSRMETIKLLLSTLRHEINNPLGAVLGGAYLLRSSGSLEEEQAEALELIEGSSQRIKHVIQKLCEAADLEEVTKGSEKLFQVPGDPTWQKKGHPDKQS